MLGSKILRWSLAGLVFILPLAFFPLFYSSFELPKVLIFYLFGGLIFAGLLIGNFAIKQYHLLTVLVFGLLGWMVVVSLIGVSLEQSFWGNYFRRQGIITYIGYLGLFLASAALLRHKFDRYLVSLSIASSSMFVAVLSIFQFISLSVFGNSGQLLYDSRSIATFGQPNFLAAYLLLSIPFIWYLSQIVTKKNQLFAWLAIGIVAVGLIVTFSRSAILALTLLTFIWGIFNWKKFLVVLIGVCLLAVTFVMIFPNIANNQLKRLEVDILNNWALGSWSGENRFQILEKSTNLSLVKPITGWGAENVNLAFPTVVTSLDYGLKDIIVDSSHNLVLDKIIETGFVGLILFLGLIFMVIWQAFKQLRHQDYAEKQFSWALIAVVVAFLIVHQFSIVSIVPGVLFWIALGGLSGNVIIHHAGTVQRIKVLLSILIILVISLFCIQTIKADMLFKEASRYEVSRIKQAIKLNQQALDNAPWTLFYAWRKQFLQKQLGE